MNFFSQLDFIIYDSLRLANNLGSSAESFMPLKSFMPANRTMKCCPQCSQSYEKEISEIEAASPPEVKSEVAQPKQLPQWLLKAKPVHRLPVRSGYLPQLQWLFLSVGNVF